MANALEYAQDVFEAAFVDAEKASKPIKREAAVRVTVAYGLKAIAVFGGLAIAFGVPDAMAHKIGIAIAVAVALDGLFLNHARMLAVTKASQAYDRLLRDVRRTHQRELLPVLQKRDKRPEDAEGALLALLKKLTERLHAECRQIEAALADLELKVLKQLSLDTERAKK